MVRASITVAALTLSLPVWAGAGLQVAAEGHGATHAEKPLRQPDGEAIQDAIGAPDDVGTYVSSRAYSHFLEAKLAENRGDLAAALTRLQQALIFDEGAPEIHLGLARLLLKIGQREQAMERLSHFLARAPEDAQAHALIGSIHRMEGRVREALASFARALRSDPDLEEAYLASIDLLVGLGRVEEAEELAQRITVRRPGQGRAWRVLAVLAGEAGRPDLSLRSLRRAVEEEPGHLSAVLQLAAREEEGGGFDEALRLYGMVLARDPTHATALLGSARIAMRRGDEAGANAFLHQLFGTHPDPVGVRLQTAMDLESARRPHRAMQVLDEAGTLSSDPRISFFRGWVLEGQRNYAQAASAYSQVAASAGPLYPLSRARWAVCLSLLGATDESLRLMELAHLTSKRLGDDDTLEEVLRLIPDVYRRAGRSPDAVALLRTEATRLEGRQGVVLALASALLDTGQSGEAILLLQTHSDDHPSESALFALAVAKERAGDPLGAVEVAQRMLESDPGNPSLLNFMGYVLADHGLQLEEARGYLIRAVEARPEDPAFLDSLGWCELQRGDLEAAEPLLLRAAALRPDDPEILHHVAELHLRTSRLELAVATWQQALQALRRDPDARLRGIIENRLVRVQSKVR